VPTDYNTIQSYNKNAHRWASLQKSAKRLTHTYIEKPAVYGQLPTELRGLSILCEGCGSGEECAFLAEKDALVSGLDISDELIKIARYSVPGVDFCVGDQENLPYSDESFDIVFSSLVIHYSNDWGRVMSEAYRVLKHGGTFVFSTHHPVRWGAEASKTDGAESFLMGYTKEESAHEGDPIRYTVHGDYLTERRVQSRLIGSIDIQYTHLPISSIIRLIQDSPFESFTMQEPTPILECKDTHPSLFEIHTKIPLFIVCTLTK
jgi:SAM-dependent methyltransferase